MAENDGCENNESDLEDVGEQARKIWSAKHLRPSARCGHCGSAEIAVLRTFATGSGSVFRTLVDDIYCLRCGYMGQPQYQLDENESRRPGTDKTKR